MLIYNLKEPLHICINYQNILLLINKSLLFINFYIFLNIPVLLYNHRINNIKMLSHNKNLLSLNLHIFPNYKFLYIY